ncbi:MAG: TonB-dependent receptor, partial [Cyanobacteria bacterium J06649_11]
LDFNVTNKKWADRFRVSVNGSEYYKEVQNGQVLSARPFGNVFYEGGGWTVTGFYEKTLGDKFKFSTNTAVSRVKVIFVDTTANIYSWSGDIISRNISQRGELVAAQNSDRDFDNIANRTTLVWTPSLSDKITLSNLVANQSNVGRDFEEEDPERVVFTKEQSIFKNVLGLEYRRLLFNDKLGISLAGKLYSFKLDGVDPNTFRPVSADGNEIGYYATAKYSFTDRLFVRASYENALRIPTSAQFFGNGADVGQNLLLGPETSDNYNVGFSYTSPRAREVRFLLAASGFVRQQQDLIFLNSFQFPRFINADNVETLGAEGALTVWFRENFQLTINATRLRQRYGEITSLSQSTFLEGTDFPNVPKWFYNARLTYNNKNLLGDRNFFAAYIQHKYVDEFNFLNASGGPDQPIPENSLLHAQRRTYLGVNLTFQDGKYGVAINANNIFNADLFDNFSVPRPGRNYNIRLSYNLRDF